MARIHTDLSRVPISVAPSPATSGTTLGVTDANAAFLPDTYPYWAVCVPTGQAPTRSNSEIVKVTGGSSSGGTTTLTIVRAQGIPVTTAQTVTTSFDIYDANSSEANIGLNSLMPLETLSGTVNGSNTVFDTSTTYVAGSIHVFRDGQLMSGGGVDYTETDNNTITFVAAPETGSLITAWYQHIVSTTGNADTLDGYHANETPTASNIPVLDSSARLPYADAWTPAVGSWSYASASTITVSSGAASIYQVGMWVKFTQTTVKYFKIIAITDTVLTFLVNTDYTVANAAITAGYYSSQECPVGVPDGFNYTTTITTTWTIGNGSVVAKCWMQGKRVKVNILLTMGATSSFGAGQVTFTAPVTNASAFLSSGSLTVFDSSGTARTAGTAVISSGIIYPIITGASYGIITNTSPYTLATGDQISVNIEYSI